MSDSPIPPLPRDIIEALELERTRSMPDDTALAALRDRIGHTAVSLGASAGAASAGAGVSAVAATSTAKVIALVAVSTVVGAIGGGGTVYSVMRSQQPPREQVVEPQRPAVEAIVLAPPSTAIPPTDAPPPPTTRPSSRYTSQTAPAPAVVPTIETERLLVEQASIALARGDASAALEACAAHERLFPRGLLVEERESVAIRALVALGKRQNALERARAFGQRFPTSLQRPIIDEVLKFDGGVTDSKGAYKNAVP